MQIHTHIDIAAPVEHVWDILTDFDAYPSWNPMIPELRGRLAVGARLDFKIKMNARIKVPLSVELVTVDAPHELRWVGPRMPQLRRVLCGSHYFKLDPLTPGSCTFRHGEDFTGLAIPERWQRGEAVLTPIYTKLNRALARRAESSYDATKN